jgi:anti-sigma regulatory factor (Ser/Thr protein kinase)
MIVMSLDKMPAPSTSSAIPPPLPPVRPRVLRQTPQQLELSVPSLRTSVEEALSMLRVLDAELPEKKQEEIAVGVRELLMNAAEHGGHFEQDRQILVLRQSEPDRISYVITDSGSGFHPDALPHAAYGRADNDVLAHARIREEQGMRPGGFGLVLARGVFDELLWNEQGNSVRATKRR